MNALWTLRAASRYRITPSTAPTARLNALGYAYSHEAIKALESPVFASWAVCRDAA